MKFASVGARLLAGIIDVCIVGAGIILLEYITKPLQISSGIIFIILLGLGCLYTPLLCASRWQSTLGMRVMHLRMVDYDGKRLSRDQCMRRSIFETLLVMISCCGVLYGCYFVYVNSILGDTERRQFPPDVYGKTFIIHVER